MSLPVHRWFRYSAGFSASWIEEVIRDQSKTGQLNILDPFAGSGTVLLEAENAGAEAIGIESHPFVARITNAKLNWRANVSEFREHAEKTLRSAKDQKGDAESYSPLIRKCFPDEVLIELDALRSGLRIHSDNSAVSELTWLALVSILRECSPVGTAQWQYILPKKTKSRSVAPYDAFRLKIAQMCMDMASRQRIVSGPKARCLQGDARDCANISKNWADLVVTSPPYANNYDYADATRLEMSFMGEVNGWGDLQDVVRKHLVRSCTQHVAAIGAEVEEVLSNRILSPIEEDLRRKCEELRAEKHKHGGKKPYDVMIACYFLDLASSWKALRNVTRDGGRICFVIGDSAPYGIYIPVDKWLGELALAAGFKKYFFEKTRDRNIKWKNRKHRVPLKEGRLWIEA